MQCCATLTPLGQSLLLLLLVIYFIIYLIDWVARDYCGVCKKKWKLSDSSVPAVRPKRCHTLSNPAYRQDYTVACLNYTLQTMMPLHGWPVMAPNAYDNNNCKTDISYSNWYLSASGIDQSKTLPVNVHLSYSVSNLATQEMRSFSQPCVKPSSAASLDCYGVL